MDAETLARALEFVARGGDKHEAVKVASTPEPKVEVEHKPIDCVAIAAELAKRFEGLYLVPYLCPAGVPTIGYGATYYKDGSRVKMSDPKITKAEADELLQWMVKKEYLPAVLKFCPNVDNAKRLAMLIDFAFNLGNGRLKSSTLRKKVNADDWDAVPTELRKWTMANGKRLNGLVKRCEARVSLIV